MVHGINDITAMELDARPALYTEAAKFKWGLPKVHRLATGSRGT